MKPIVTQCAAVSDEKNPFSSRCKNLPDKKNGYFCTEHWEKHFKEPVPAIRIRDIPHFHHRGKEVIFIFVEPKKDKKMDIKKPTSIEDKTYIINKKEEIDDKKAEAAENLFNELMALKAKELISVAKDFGYDKKGRVKKREIVEFIVAKTMEGDNDKAE